MKLNFCNYIILIWPSWNCLHFLLKTNHNKKSKVSVDCWLWIPSILQSYREMIVISDAVSKWNLIMDLLTFGAMYLPCCGTLSMNFNHLFWSVGALHLSSGKLHALLRWLELEGLSSSEDYSVYSLARICSRMSESWWVWRRFVPQIHHLTTSNHSQCLLTHATFWRHD